MNRLGAWLVDSRGPFNKFWVNAKDEDGLDDVMWTDGSNSHVLGFFWSPGGEPNHHEGDCVYLNILSDPGLAMGDCEEEIFYPPCKI